ncbi:MAG TPA: hypothetical protein VGM84_24635 [Steroidobacteraceae bacterium]|jgi:hypothetical protein
MTSSARGSDLNSWWSNRASLRKEAAAALGQLRDCQRRLTAAAGGNPAPASSSRTPPSTDASITGLSTAADQIVIAMTHAQSEMERLAEARTAAQSELAAAKEQIEIDARRRIQGKARKDADRRLRSRKAMGWATQKICRLASVGVVVLMVYLLSVY